MVPQARPHGEQVATGDALARAGINVRNIRIIVFMISGAMAGLGGVVLAARLNSVDLNAGGGTLSGLGVSVSYASGQPTGRHQILDLIDDLIHENSHHHLNLLLRKHVMYRGDHNQQIFYSPWRRSLRPLRGILHATFTFTMGALLFQRLSSWASGRGGAASRFHTITLRRK